MFDPLKSLVVLMLLASTFQRSKAVARNAKYQRVGTVSNEISSSFMAYNIPSKITCFGLCAQLDCALVGWGPSATDGKQCRLLKKEPRSTGPSTMESLSAPVTLYTVSNTLTTFLQKSYALLIHVKATPGATLTWFDTRDYCRNYGLAIYTPASNDELSDILQQYGNFWTGTNDLTTEGVYLMDDGNPFSGTWCPGNLLLLQPKQPDNFFDLEDCSGVNTVFGPCFCDASCVNSLLYDIAGLTLIQGFCLLGK